jgi:hypothetical protein
MQFLAIIFVEYYSNLMLMGITKIMLFAETDIHNKKGTAGKPANNCPEMGCTQDAGLF